MGAAACVVMIKPVRWSLVMSVSGPSPAHQPSEHASASPLYLTVHLTRWQLGAERAPSADQSLNYIPLNCVAAEEPLNTEDDG